MSKYLIWILCLAGMIVAATLLVVWLNSSTPPLAIDNTSYLSDVEVKREAQRYSQGLNNTEATRAQIRRDSEAGVLERRLIRALFARQWTRQTAEKLSVVERASLKTVLGRMAESDSSLSELAELPNDTQIEVKRRRDGWLEMRITRPGTSVSFNATPE